MPDLCDGALMDVDGIHYLNVEQYLNQLYPVFENE